MLFKSFNVDFDDANLIVWSAIGPYRHLISSATRATKGQDAIQCLETSVIGVEIESNFNASESYLNTHFGAVLDILTPRDFRVCDIVFDRHLGRPSTLDALFCRELPHDAEADTVLKPAIISELYGLSEFASTTIAKHIRSVRNVDDNLLSSMQSIGDERATASEQLNVVMEQLRAAKIELAGMRESTSWRITAPMRALKSALRR
jgi:hypothetical protein